MLDGLRLMGCVEWLMFDALPIDPIHHTRSILHISYSDYSYVCMSHSGFVGQSGYRALRRCAIAHCIAAHRVV